MNKSSVQRESVVSKGWLLTEGQGVQCSAVTQLASQVPQPKKIQARSILARQVKKTK